MFEVKHKETGAVHTVYGRNGLMFLLYDEDEKQWVWKCMEEFEPYHGGDDNA